MITFNTINGNLDIEDAWEIMEKSEGEKFCTIDDDGKVIGIVKKNTVGVLRLKYLKQQLGSIDL